MSQLVTADAVLLTFARRESTTDARHCDRPRVDGARPTCTASSSRPSAAHQPGSGRRHRRTLLIIFGYPIAMETLTRGRQVGAFALGLRVVRDDGGAIRFRQALLRGLRSGPSTSARSPGCGGLVCRNSERAIQALRRSAGGTIVIRTRSPRAPHAIPVPPALAAWASQLELSGLPDELVTAARHLVQRHDGLLRFPKVSSPPTWPARLPTVLLPRHRGAPNYDFLAAVVAERRRRERPADEPAVGSRGRRPACRLEVEHGFAGEVECRTGPRGASTPGLCACLSPTRTLVLVRHADLPGIWMA